MGHQFVPIALTRLHLVVEVGTRLHHRCAAHSLSHHDHAYAQRDDPRRVDCRLVIGKERRSHQSLDEGHGMGLSVLVAVGEEERGDVRDRGVVRGRRVKLEEVEHGQRAEKHERPP